MRRAGSANKVSQRPGAHPAGERIMNKQSYLTGNCHLQSGNYKQIGIMFNIKSGRNYLGGMRSAPSSLMQQPLSIVFSMM
jgi:hypothetical protein